MRVLLTNDDGYDAPGLASLYEALCGMDAVEGVWVVAPKKVQSATSHAITLHRLLEVERRNAPGSGGPATAKFLGGWAVDGRPADCVKLALDSEAGLLAGGVDLVVSGTNAGANIGLNVLYSGTVGAAREAGFAGVPAIAVSQLLRVWADSPWERSGEFAAEAMTRVLEHRSLGEWEHGTVMNINLPALEAGAEPRGIVPAELCMDHVAGVYERREVEDDGDGQGGAAGEVGGAGGRYRMAFQAGSTLNYGEPPTGTDAAELFAGWTTVTPLHFDLTHAGEVAAMRQRWEVAETPG
ncbi:MAG: 5'/3'-nucleotidase SurE [Planctomycetota bacterium]